MLAASKVKMSGSEKKKKKEQERVTRKIHVATTTAKKFPKKGCYTCKVVGLFLLIRPTDFFAVLRRLRRLALHDFIF